MNNFESIFKSLTQEFLPGTLFTVMNSESKIYLLIGWYYISYCEDTVSLAKVLCADGKIISLNCLTLSAANIIHE